MPQEPQYILQDSSGTDLGIVYANEDGNLVLHNAGQGDEVVLKNGGLYNNPATESEAEFAVGQAEHVVGPTGKFDTIQAAVDDIGQSGGTVKVQSEYDASNENFPIRILYANVSIQGEDITTFQVNEDTNVFYIGTFAEADEKWGGAATGEGKNSNRPPGVSISGLKIKHFGNGDTFHVSGTSFTHLSDIVVYGNGSDGDAFYVDRGPFDDDDNFGSDETKRANNTCYMEKVSAYDVGGHGYRVIAGQHALTQVNCTWLNCGRMGCRVENSSSVAFYGCVFEDCTDPGLFLSGIDSVVVSGAYVEGNATSSSNLSPNGQYSADIQVTNGVNGGYLGGIYSNGQPTNEDATNQWALALAGNCEMVEVGHMSCNHNSKAALYVSTTGDGIVFDRRLIYTESSTPAKVDHNSNVSLGRIYENDKLFAYGNDWAGVDLTSISPQFVGERALSNGTSTTVHTGTVATANENGNWVATNSSSVTTI